MSETRRIAVQDAFFAGLMAQMDAERKAAADNMTLGGLIAALSKCRPEWLVALASDHAVSVGRFISYRGYYEDLCLTPSRDYMTVERLLGLARDARGQVMQGYKGGDFPMHDASLVWIAEYGSTGDKLVGVKEVSSSGMVYLETAPDATA